RARQEIAAEIGAQHPGAHKTSFLKLGIGEVRVIQYRLAEIHAWEIRHRQIGSRKIRAERPPVTNISLIEVCAYSYRSGKIRSNEIRPLLYSRIGFMRATFVATLGLTPVQEERFIRQLLEQNAGLQTAPCCAATYIYVG